MKVIFRKFREGDVIALLIEQNFKNRSTSKPDMVMSYQHVGQHSEASKSIVRDTKLATPEEYADLKAELERIYNEKIVVVKRFIRG